MDNEGQQADQLLLNKINYAEAVASRYQRAHPRLDLEDCLSMAREAAWRSTLVECPVEVLAKRVEKLLRSLLRKVKREAERYISLERIADCAEGEPLPSFRALRSAPSLNPPADNTVDSEALQHVQASAVKQNCPAHPEHEWYLSESAANCERVAKSLKRRNEITAQVVEFHSREDRALQVAA